jgi:hypothetical protein
MLTLLCFLLVLIAILMAIRILPLALLAAGYWWLWEAHRWVLVAALIIGGILGVWRSLSKRDQPDIHRLHSSWKEK